jgi:hypothetical protein
MTCLQKVYPDLPGVPFRPIHQPPRQYCPLDRPEHDPQLRHGERMLKGLFKEILNGNWIQKPKAEACANSC